jgi:hypothetical protein
MLVNIGALSGEIAEKEKGRWPPLESYCCCSLCGASWVDEP